jgi:hypothetical protein
LTAAGTAGGNGTLTCVFIDVKAMLGGEAVLVSLITSNDATPWSRLPPL